MKKNIILTLIITVIAFLLMSGSCQDKQTPTDNNNTACLWIVTFQQSEGLKIVNPGGTYNFIRQVNNDGPAVCNNVLLRYFFSTDEVINNSDTYLNFEETLNLTSGGYSVTGVNLTIPNWATPGTRYYVGVLINSSSCTSNCSTYKSWDVTISGTPPDDITTSTTIPPTGPSTTTPTTIPTTSTTTPTTTTSTTTPTTTTSTTSTTSSTTSTTSTTTSVCTYTVGDKFLEWQDSTLNPGVIAWMDVGVKNTGNCTAENLTVAGTCISNCSQVGMTIQSSYNFGNVSPGSSVYHAASLAWQVSGTAPSGTSITFRITFKRGTIVYSGWTDKTITVN